MAQVLKDSVRQSIVDAAIQEMLEVGYEKSSMRNIASNAKMTVGNLYRYFKNKEEMIKFIIYPVMDKIDNKIRLVTNESISLNEDSLYIEDFVYENILVVLDQIAIDIVEIYNAHPKIMRIIMMESSFNNRLRDWCANLVLKLFKYENNNDINHDIYNVLAHVYASSMFAAMKEALTNDVLSKDETIKIIRIYFRSFLNELEVKMEI